jgi:hypothetical protein
VDVVLSSDDDDDDACLPEHDASGDRDVLTVDDAGGVGTTSAEAAIPGPIGAGAPSTIRPPAADRVAVVPPSGVHQ